MHLRPLFQSICAAKTSGVFLHGGEITERKDGNNIVFNFEIKTAGKSTVLYIQKGVQRLLVNNLHTEKTLPQTTPIKVFPSSIILDKNGTVRKLDNSFFGPGTGKHFEAYKRNLMKR